MASYLTLVEQLSEAVDQLNQVLQGDENTTVTINGIEQPSVQKKTVMSVSEKTQLILDAAADIDAIKYKSVDAGIASGSEFFSVVSDNDDSYLDLYKNESGTAVFKKSYPSKLIVDEINNRTIGGIYLRDIVLNENSDMTAPNDWVLQSGTPSIEFKSGKMEVTFPQGTTSAISLRDLGLVSGRKYEIRATISLVSGNPSLITLGAGFSSGIPKHSVLCLPLPNEVYEIKKVIEAGSQHAWIGTLSGENNGITIAIHELRILEIPKDYYEKESSNDFLINKMYGNKLRAADSFFLNSNKWEVQIGTPIQYFNDGFNIQYQANTNSSICLNKSLELGKKYKIKIICKVVSGIPSEILIGHFTSSNSLGSAKLTPTEEYELHELEIEATVDYLAIGCLAESNLGQTLRVKEILLTEINADIKTVIDEVEELKQNANDGNILDKNTSEMIIPNNWSAQLGGLSANFTSQGEMLLNFDKPSENQSIYIEKSPMKEGSKYIANLDVRVVSGIKSRLTLGKFSSETESESVIRITPGLDWKTYEFEITPSVDYFAIGSIGSDNQGFQLEVKNVKFIKTTDRLGKLESESLSKVDYKPPKAFSTDSFMSSLSKYDKKLIKFCVAGDSLMANNVGGEIPQSIDEGAGYRPIRLDINSVPRRIYDHISFNKATHIRLDRPEWIKFGEWITVNDTSVWEPPHPETLYHKTISPSAYIELKIPDGMDNFALVCHKDEGFGALEITLNGESIAGFGPSIIDLNRERVNPADRGNPFYTVEYTGLPAGENTIRVKKNNDAKECRVWGGFYWTGTTLVVHNIAHGGHTLKNLIDQHLSAEMLENNFDAILFELTVMNEMSKGRTPNQTVNDLKEIISTFAYDKDIMFMTPNPFGDNSLGINYYTTYQNPSMADTVGLCIKELHSLGIPYINVFDMFKNKIENRGGSLDGGEGGIYYTTDGQHGNIEGVREWFNLIKPHLSNKPYQDS